MNTATSAAAVLPEVKRLASGQELEQLRQTLIDRTDPNAPRILVCCGTGCKAVGSLDLLETMRNAVAASGEIGRAHV
jgi:NADH-quinone oxidoreductase subunit F